MYKYNTSVPLKDAQFKEAEVAHVSCIVLGSAGHSDVVNIIIIRKHREIPIYTHLPPTLKMYFFYLSFQKL